MGIIINIAEALQNRAEYNILREPINDMLKKKQEAWEQKNPIDLLFHRGTLNKFQETYTDTIGFAHAFAETSDYAVAPIFNTNEGFSKTYTSRTFQGGFIITQQVLEDQAYSQIKNTASKFLTRWHGDTVEYALTALDSGFCAEGEVKTWGSEANGGISRLRLTSADTTNGDPMTAAKTSLFSTDHYIVKRRDTDYGTAGVPKQSNRFVANIDVKTDTDAISKVASVINQVISKMENYKDDNGKYAGVNGQKTIVAPNDPHLIAVLNAALSMDMLSDHTPNPAYKRAVLETTPYLNDMSSCANGSGIFIVDKEYNAENQGLEFTERVALTINVQENKNPYGISYDARQRFDINVASWRGISHIKFGTDTSATTITPSTVAKNINVVNTVTTRTASAT